MSKFKEYLEARLTFPDLWSMINEYVDRYGVTEIRTKVNEYLDEIEAKQNGH